VNYTEHAKAALQLAGRLAIASVEVERCRAANLTAAIERLRQARQDYDDEIQAWTDDEDQEAHV